MDNNMVLAAGVGVAVLGGLIIMMSGRKKGPVCLPYSAPRCVRSLLIFLLKLGIRSRVAPAFGLAR
jgi:hypothetical protein